MVKELNKINLSVVIAVYNGADFLKKCLPAIFEAADDKTEIILINDASTDNSSAIGKQFGAAVIDLETRGGPGNARNIGVEKAQGEIIFFVDADVLVKKETISQLRLLLSENPQFAAIFGSYDNSPAETDFFSQYRNLMHHFFHQTGDAEAQTFWSGLGAIKREIFIETGGFKISTIEDIELGYRLKKKDYRILLAADWQAKHLKKWSFNSILQTDFWGRAVPWAELILLNPQMNADLNIKPAQKISVWLTGLFLLSLPFIFWQLQILFFSLGVLAILLVINHNFYRFFLKHKGLWFTSRVFPMHLFYFLYSGIAFAYSLINVKIFGRTIIVK